MSRTPRSRPTGAAAAVGVVIAAFALAGCGAGQVTQTAEQVSAVGGAAAGSGEVVVRNAEIEFAEQVEIESANVYTRGGAAPLQMSIVNTGPTADRLVSVSSPVATTVQVSGDTDIPGGQVLVVEGQPAPRPSAPRSGTARATGTPAPTSAAAEGSPEAQIVLTGLRDDIRAGLTYPVVLTFERAGEIRFAVPVANPTEPREDEPAE